MKLEVHEIPQEPVRAPKEFTLVINDEEAAFLDYVMSNVGGSMSNSYRKLADRFSSKLHNEICQATRDKIRNKAASLYQGMLWFNDGV